MASSFDVADSVTLAGALRVPQPGKIFSRRVVGTVDTCARPNGALLAPSSGMTTVPRDSDVIGAAVLLAVVLITGIRALL